MSWACYKCGNYKTCPDHNYECAICGKKHITSAYKVKSPSGEQIVCHLCFVGIMDHIYKMKNR